MQLRTIKITMISAIIFFAAVRFVFASGSGGIRVEIPDAEAFGKGSAFIGEADNPSAVNYNPAGLTQLEGTQLTVGGAVISPAISYTDFNGRETQMARQNFKLPHFYLTSDLGVENWMFGVGGNSSWGLGTSFAEDSFARYNATDADLVMIDSMLTAAYKFNEQWSFALSADSVYSTANKAKKLAQTGAADGDFNLKGKDTAWGYRIATHYRLNDHHRFGLMYRSPLALKYRGKAFLHELNAGGSNYAAIFGSDRFETRFAQEFELPQSVALGYSFQPNTKWTFNFDTEWFDWSSVKYDLVQWTDVLTANQAAVLNAGNPSNRDWRSVWSASAGFEYAWSDDLRLRSGYYYHTTPIPDETVDSSLPDSNSHGITAGFGYDVTDNSTVDLAYSYLVYEHFTLDNSVGSSFGANLDGKYEQTMHMGVVSYSYHF